MSGPRAGSLAAHDHVTSRRWRAAPEIALDYEESLHPDLRLHTHVSDLMTTVEEVLRLVGGLTRVVAARSTAVERTIP